MQRRPEMVSGPRSPKEAPERETEAARDGMLDLAMDALAALKGERAGPQRPEGMREFGSLFRQYRLTIQRSPRREVNGIGIPAELMTVEFQNGALRTDDPVVIKAITTHKNFGRDTWDADELQERAERKAAENFLARVDTLPADIREQLKVKLGMDDFVAQPSV